jgi:hypothetical protein
VGRRARDVGRPHLSLKATAIWTLSLSLSAFLHIPVLAVFALAMLLSLGFPAREFPWTLRYGNPYLRTPPEAVNDGPDAIASILPTASARYRISNRPTRPSGDRRNSPCASRWESPMGWTGRRGGTT